MSASGRRRGERTREAILNAAEAVFADYGFAGARVDTIAAVSGFNKTLIFRYFGDKLGLYAAVLGRIDAQATQLQARLLGPLFADERIVSDAHRFRAFLTTALGAFFDFMVEHPHIMRMLLWEHAGGWQTYTQLALLFEFQGFEQVETLFSQARLAGLLRSDGDPFVLLLLAEQICWSVPTALPFYQMVLPTRDFSSAEALAGMREQVIAFLVAGILADLKDDAEGAPSERESRSKLKEKGDDTG
jgi:TetR/AcrR family transcriptional regulator